MDIRKARNKGRYVKGQRMSDINEDNNREVKG